MVERFDLVQYEHFDQLDRAFNGDWVRYSDHEAELSALAKQVEELTAERDEEAKCVDYAEKDFLKAIARAESAEAEAAALREALEEIRKLSGLDDLLIEGASAIVMSRMADIHQHSDAALTSTKETSE